MTTVMNLHKKLWMASIASASRGRLSIVYMLKVIDWLTGANFGSVRNSFIQSSKSFFVKVCNSIHLK